MFYRSLIFFFNDTATTEIYTLSLHDALPIWRLNVREIWPAALPVRWRATGAFERAVKRTTPAGTVISISLEDAMAPEPPPRSEEHTSELQSRQYLVCRLLLEKKKSTSSRRSC